MHGENKGLGEGIHKCSRKFRSFILGNHTLTGGEGKMDILIKMLYKDLAMRKWEGAFSAYPPFIRYTHHLAAIQASSPRQRMSSLPCTSSLGRAAPYLPWFLSQQHRKYLRPRPQRRVAPVGKRRRKHGCASR